MISRRLARFSWAVLGYNVAVILWGAWVRVTGSGAGCGNHWPTCNGEVIPVSPSVHTLIEYSHRATSGLAGLLTLALFAWTFWTVSRGHPARRAAAWSLGFVSMEGLIGAVLVKFALVTFDASTARVFTLCAHLGNTLMLLAALTVTAWHLSGGRSFGWGGPGAVARALRWSLGALVLVVMSGGIAALGDTLYPAQSLAHGMAQDLSDTAPLLVRIRLLHPILAVLTAVLVFGVALYVRAEVPSGKARSRAGWVCGAVIAQCALGVLNVLLLAPGWLQIVHLCVGDAVWIAVVLMAAESLSHPDAEASVPAPALTQPTHAG